MKPAVPTIDVSIASASWKRGVGHPGSVCRKAARAAWTKGAPPALRRRADRIEISVVLTSDAAIRRLNAAYRGKDRPTNVLSFATEGVESLGLGRVGILGDVVIAYGTVAREARAAGKPLKNHLSHMVVHGVLHLLGYDHESAPDAETMERLETYILSRLGVPDPYAAAAPKPASPRRARRQT